MFDIRDLRATIVPKSDQLNAEQLLGGSITVQVTEVRIGSSDEQPISIHYAGDDGRPYKPCKTMRKVLVFAWGQDGHQWHGRSLTLYNDPGVKFGGHEVGGIRISHISHIERDLQVSLTATKGKKALHNIKRLKVAAAVNHGAALPSTESVDSINPDLGPQARAKRITDGVADGDAEGAAAALAGFPEPEYEAVWALLDGKTQNKLIAAWPVDS